MLEAQWCLELNANFTMLTNTSFLHKPEADLFMLLLPVSMLQVIMFTKFAGRKSPNIQSLCKIFVILINASIF